MIYCAAVDKIEEKRKPEDFSGHRKRDKLFCGTQSAACGGYSEMIYCAAVDKIEEKRKPEDFSGHRKRERL